MNNLNFLVDHIGASQMAFSLLRKSQHFKNPTTIFCDRIRTPCLQPMVPVMQIIEAWGQNGISIATSVDMADRLLSFPCANKRFFYVWDMSWMDDNRKFINLSHIFRGIEIIARSEYHAKLIGNNFNVNVNHICDNFEIDNILKELG